MSTPAFPTAAPAGFAAPPRRAGTAGLWWGGGLLLAGLLAGVVAIGLGIGGIFGQMFGFVGDADELQRVGLGGSGEVRLPAGEATLYLETTTAGARHPVGESRVVVRPAGGGAPLDTDAVLARYTYTSGNRTGVAVRTVDVPRDGRYVVEAEAPDARPGTVIAVGAGPPLGLDVGRQAAIGGAGLLLALVLLGAGAVVLGVALVRRGRAGPPPGPPPAGWPPPAWG